MPNICAVYRCGDWNITGASSIALHKFPSNDENRMAKWIAFANRGANWHPTRYSRICSKHFKDPKFDSLKRILSDPTVNALSIKDSSEPSPKVTRFTTKLNILCEKNDSIKFEPHKITVGNVSKHGPDCDLQLHDIVGNNQNAIIPKRVDNQTQTANVSKSSNCSQTDSQKNDKETQIMPCVEHGATQTEIKQMDNKSVQIRDQKRESLIQRLLQQSRNNKNRIRKLKSELKAEKQVNSGFKKIMQKISMKSKSTILSTILDRLRSKKNYDSQIRQFAMTLHFYSSRAYGFVRRNLLNLLPSSRQLRFWNQDIVVRPGLLPQCLQALKEKSSTSKCITICNLQIDEMSIRQQIISNGTSYDGYVDYGGLWKAPNQDEMAKNAMIVMAVGVNGHWKIPIAYYLTKGVSAEFIAAVVQQAMEALRAVNVNCVSVTYDGLASNLKSAKILGAKLELPSLSPYFIGLDGNKKYIIPDICHMLKLLRNLWKSVGTIYIDSQKIKWTYIHHLEMLQGKEGLKAGNKLSCRHINFERQKMKVNIAAQVFSQSVAKALRLCKKLKLPNFNDEDCDNTSDFVELINNFFDLLNSKNPLSKSYSAPLKKETEKKWLQIFSKAVYAFSNMKTSDGNYIIKSKKKTALLGFITAIKSFEGMYNDLVNCDNPLLKYILTYKFSQDHTETYFSVLRSCQGFNNNPNVKQLQYAIRKSLSTKISPSNTGNCIIQDCTEVTFAVSINKSVDILPEQNGDLENVITKDLSLFSECVVTYIAGWVVKKIKSKLKCLHCINSLESTIDSTSTQPEYELVRIKQNGGLIVPSNDVNKVCKTTEKLFKAYGVCSNFRLDNLLSKVFSHLLQDRLLFSGLNSHILDLSPLDNHIAQLIKLISRTYCTVRMHYSAKKETLDQKPQSVRIQNNKMTHFEGV